jgi:hypothetical protein
VGRHHWTFAGQERACPRLQQLVDGHGSGWPA